MSLAATDSHSTDAHLKAIEASLPPAPNPIGSYVTHVQQGNLIFTSGMLPMKEGSLLMTGAVTPETIPQSQDAARQCVMNALSLVTLAAGSLANVKRVVKVTGFVNAGAEFTQHPAVINGASDYLVEVFGEAGKHARAAVGVASLPMNASVEIEIIVELNS
jgi:enamine deaminase RidA (YjgF/YER057c/UK114 family)